MKKDALKEIRGRRTITAEQARTMLDLFASSDVETKRSLLNMASRSLNDAIVLERWIELAGDEKDTDLRLIMVGRLLSIDIRKVPDPGAFVRLLTGALKEETIRGAALAKLGRILPVHPEVAGILIEHYKGLRQNTPKRMIIVALLAIEDPPPQILALLKSVLDKVDADLKPAIVDRLLRRNALKPAELEALLQPSEPAGVKWLVLFHGMDRSAPLSNAVRQAILKDPDPNFRREAIWMLATRGGAEAAALTDSALKDSDPSVRGEALVALRSAVGANPELAPALLAVLKKDTSGEIVSFVLDLLTPLASRLPVVRQGLLDLLRGNLKAAIAAKVYEALGKLLVWDRAMLDHFIEAYDKEEDGVKAAILGAISNWHEPDERLTKIFRAGVKSPSPKIREWALRGLLLVPMTEANCAIVGLGAELLLDKAVDYDIRILLARKIAFIPHLAPNVATALKNVADQASDGDMKDVCQKAADRAASSVGTAAIDWDQWFRRVDVEHNVDGIFPDIWRHYDSNPDMGRKILRAMLNPGCGNPLYQIGVNESAILNFLVRKKAIDDDVSRYCVNWILTKGSEYGNPDYHLAMLKSNPGFPALKESLWQIFEGRPTWNPGLMRELLVLSHGGDSEAAKAVRKKLGEKKAPKPAKPYLHFLAGNLAWADAGEILADCAKKALLDDDNLMIVVEALRELGKDADKVLGKKEEGPGFADE